MQKINNIIKSEYPPINPNDIWLDSKYGILKLFNEKEGQWNSTGSTINTSSNDIIPITYDQLKELAETASLKVGGVYRITDYVSTGVFNNPETTLRFDIVVRAATESLLEDEAKAVPNELTDNNYIEGMSKWRVWYSLYPRHYYSYAQYETTNIDFIRWDKGGIYRLIDEFNNDFDYDFKSLKVSGELYTFNFDRSEYSYSGLFKYNRSIESSPIIYAHISNLKESKVYSNIFVYSYINIKCIDMFSTNVFINSNCTGIVDTMRNNIIINSYIPKLNVIKNSSSYSAFFMNNNIFNSDIRTTIIEVQDSSITNVDIKDADTYIAYIYNCYLHNSEIQRSVIIKDCNILNSKITIVNDSTVSSNLPILTTSITNINKSNFVEVHLSNLSRDSQVDIVRSDRTIVEV